MKNGIKWRKEEKKIGPHLSSNPGSATANYNTICNVHICREMNCQESIHQRSPPNIQDDARYIFHSWSHCVEGIIPVHGPNENL